MNMKGLVLAAALLLALPLHAFDAGKKADRIGLLRIAEGGDVGDAIIDSLRVELRKAGFDAYTVPATRDELREGAGADADFYVEVAGESSTTPHGEVAVATRHVDVSVAVVVSRLAAELRIYDGATLELIGTHELNRKSTAVLPTSVGVGGRAFYAAVALPFARWAQTRRAMRSAAREAAQVVTAAVNVE